MGNLLSSMAVFVPCDHYPAKGPLWSEPTSLMAQPLRVSSFLWHSGRTSEVVEVPISSKSFFFLAQMYFCIMPSKMAQNFLILVQTMNFQCCEKSRFEKLQNSPRWYGSSVTCDVQPGLQSLRFVTSVRASCSQT